MGPVAEGWIGRVFALAEPDLFLFRDGEFLGGKAAAFMGAVAEGLMRGEAAGTPPVVPGLEFDGDRLAGGDFGQVAHGGSGWGGVVDARLGHPRPMKRSMPGFAALGNAALRGFRK